MQSRHETTARRPYVLDHELCDPDAALVRLDGDEELLRKLIEFFQEDYPQMLVQLESATVAGRARDVERAAHSLKNLSSTFDGHLATRVALEVEELGRDGDLVGAVHAIPMLRRQFARLSEALARYVAGSNS